ncbi:hypothetical protein ACVWYG_000027 [Pedobacter sp. UYEF25]
MESLGNSSKKQISILSEKTVTSSLLELYTT